MGSVTGDRGPPVMRNVVLGLCIDPEPFKLSLGMGVEDAPAFSKEEVVRLATVLTIMAPMGNSTKLQEVSFYFKN